MQEILKKILVNLLLNINQNDGNLNISVMEWRNNVVRPQPWANPPLSWERRPVFNGPVNISPWQRPFQGCNNNWFPPPEYPPRPFPPPRPLMPRMSHYPSLHRPLYSGNVRPRHEPYYRSYPRRRHHLDDIFLANHDDEECDNRQEEQHPRYSHPRPSSVLIKIRPETKISKPEQMQIKEGDSEQKNDEKTISMNDKNLNSSNKNKPTEKDTSNADSSDKQASTNDTPSVSKESTGKTPVIIKDNNSTINQKSAHVPEKNKIRKKTERHTTRQPCNSEIEIYDAQSDLKIDKVSKTNKKNLETDTNINDKRLSNTKNKNTSALSNNLNIPPPRSTHQISNCDNASGNQKKTTLIVDDVSSNNCSEMEPKPFVGKAHVLPRIPKNSVKVQGGNDDRSSTVNTTRNKVENKDKESLKLKTQRQTLNCEQEVKTLKNRNNKINANNKNNKINQLSKNASVKTSPTTDSNSDIVNELEKLVNISKLPSTREKELVICVEKYKKIDKDCNLEQKGNLSSNSNSLVPQIKTKITCSSSPKNSLLLADTSKVTVGDSFSSQKKINEVPKGLPSKISKSYSSAKQIESNFTSGLSRDIQVVEPELTTIIIDDDDDDDDDKSTTYNNKKLDASEITRPSTEIIKIEIPDGDAEKCQSGSNSPTSIEVAKALSQQTQQCGDFDNLDTRMTYLYSFKRYFDDPRTLDMEISNTPSPSKNADESALSEQQKETDRVLRDMDAMWNDITANKGNESNDSNKASKAKNDVFNKSDDSKNSDQNSIEPRITTAERYEQKKSSRSLPSNRRVSSNNNKKEISCVKSSGKKQLRLNTRKMKRDLKKGLYNFPEGNDDRSFSQPALINKKCSPNEISPDNGKRTKHISLYSEEVAKSDKDSLVQQIDSDVSNVVSENVDIDNCEITQINEKSKKTRENNSTSTFQGADLPPINITNLLKQCKQILGSSKEAKTSRHKYRSKSLTQTTGLKTTNISMRKTKSLNNISSSKIKFQPEDFLTLLEHDSNSNTFNNKEFIVTQEQHKYDKSSEERYLNTSDSLDFKKDELLSLLSSSNTYETALQSAKESVVTSTDCNMIITSHRNDNGEKDDASNVVVNINDKNGKSKDTIRERKRKRIRRLDSFDEESMSPKNSDIVHEKFPEQKGKRKRKRSTSRPRKNKGIKILGENEPCGSICDSNQREFATAKNVSLTDGESHLEVQNNNCSSNNLTEMQLKCPEKDKYITKAEYVKTFGRIKSPVNVTLSIGPQPKSANIKERRATFTCETDKEILLKRSDNGKIRERCLLLFGHLSEDEDELIPNAGHNNTSQDNQIINSTAKANPKNVSGRRKSRSVEKISNCIQDSQMSNNSISKLETQKSKETERYNNEKTISKDTSAKLLKCNERRESSSSTDSRSRDTRHKRHRHETVKMQETTQEPELSFKRHMIARRDSISSTDSSKGSQKNKKKKTEKHLPLEDTPMNVDSTRKSQPYEKKETKNLPDAHNGRTKIDTNYIKSKQKPAKIKPAKKLSVKNPYKQNQQVSRIASRIDSSISVNKTTSQMQNIALTKPGSTSVKKLTDICRRRSAPDILSNASETLISDKGKSLPVICRATENDIINESIESCNSSSFIMPTPERLIRIETVENECTDTVYIDDSPDVKNDSTVVKQSPARHDDDVIEITPSIPTIDLTEDDGRQYSTSPQKTLADLFLETKREIQELAAEEGITLYRSEESNCDPENLKVLPASVSLASFSSHDFNLKENSSPVISNVASEEVATLQTSNIEKSRTNCFSLQETVISSDNSAATDNNQTIVSPVVELVQQPPKQSSIATQLIDKNTNKFGSQDINWTNIFENASATNKSSPNSNGSQTCNNSLESNTTSDLLTNNQSTNKTSIQNVLPSAGKAQQCGEQNELLLQKLGGRRPLPRAQAMNESSPNSNGSQICNNSSESNTTCDLLTNNQLTNSTPVQNVLPSAGKTQQCSGQNEILLQRLSGCRPSPREQATNESSPNSNDSQICSNSSESNTTSNLLADNQSTNNTHVQNILPSAGKTQQCGVQHELLLQRLRGCIPLLRAQVPSVTTSIAQQLDRIAQSNLDNAKAAVNCTNENFELSTIDLRLIVEIFTRHAYFLAHLCNAQKAYVESLNQRPFFKHYFKAEIELFEEQKKHRLFRQSVRLWTEIQMLNIRASRNLSQAVSLIVEHMTVNLATKDMPKRVTKSMIYLLLGELIKPQVEMFATVPLMKTLIRHCSSVTNKIYSRSLGPFTEEMRRTLAVQVEEYNKLCRQPLLSLNQRSNSQCSMSTTNRQNEEICSRTNLNNSNLELPKEPGSTHTINANQNGPKQQQVVGKNKGNVSLSRVLDKETLTNMNAKSVDRHDPPPNNTRVQGRANNSNQNTVFITSMDPPRSNVPIRHQQQFILPTLRSGRNLQHLSSLDHTKRPAPQAQSLPVPNCNTGNQSQYLVARSGYPRSVVRSGTFSEPMRQNIQAALPGGPNTDRLGSTPRYLTNYDVPTHNFRYTTFPLRNNQNVNSSQTLNSAISTLDTSENMQVLENSGYQTVLSKNRISQKSSKNHNPTQYLRSLPNALPLNDHPLGSSQRNTVYQSSDNLTGFLNSSQSTSSSPMEMPSIDSRTRNESLLEELLSSENQSAFTKPASPVNDNFRIKLPFTKPITPPITTITTSSAQPLGSMTLQQVDVAETCLSSIPVVSSKGPTENLTCVTEHRPSITQIHTPPTSSSINSSAIHTEVSTAKRVSNASLPDLTTTHVNKNNTPLTGQSLSLLEISCQDPIILVNNSAASSRYTVSCADQSQTNGTLNKGLAALSSIGKPSAMLQSQPQQDQHAYNLVEPNSTRQNTDSPIISISSSNKSKLQNSPMASLEKLPGKRKLRENMQPKFKTVSRKPNRRTKSSGIRERSTNYTTVKEIEIIDISNDEGLHLESAIKEVHLSDDVADGDNIENVESGTNTISISVPQDDLGLTEEYYSKDDSPLGNPSLGRDATVSSLSDQSISQSENIPTSEVPIVQSSASTACDILGPNSTGDEDDIETIDLTWIDDMDDTELQGEMNFVFVKQEKVKNEETWKQNNSVYFQAPSPADSGIASPPVQNEDDTTYTVVRSLCICGQTAEYNCACGDAWYCGQQCQLVDWESHQKVCHIPTETSDAEKEVTLHQDDDVQPENPTADSTRSDDVSSK